MLECKICNQQFKSLRDLSFHLTIVHNVPSEEYKKTENYKENLKNELLRLCEKNENGCWIWKGSIMSDGYGRYDLKRAHRLSYELFKENNIHNKLICHTCDTPLCINPNHLYSGNHQDNMNDMKKRNRSLKGLLNPSKREDVKEKLRKTWKIKTPDDEEIIVKNIMEFCYKHKLKYRTLVETGKSGGYTCQRL